MDSPYEGRLIRLRAREPEDEPLLFEWFNDPDVIQHLTVRYPFSHATEKRYLEAHSQPTYDVCDFAVDRKDTGKMIGGASLGSTSPENRSAILGIALGDKSCWDKGFGTDTMRAICRFGFETMNLHRIELEVYAPNVRARTVYERVGFQVEGCRRQANYKFGQYQDVIVMGLLEGELIPG